MGSGWPRGWVSDLLTIKKERTLLRYAMLNPQAFFMGLIQGAYCLSPTGMLASMSEEVKKPETTIPRAMYVPSAVFVFSQVDDLGYTG